MGQFQIHVLKPSNMGSYCKSVLDASLLKTVLRDQCHKLCMYIVMW